jgi:hypothetical protein
VEGGRQLEFDSIGCILLTHAVAIIADHCRSLQIVANHCKPLQIIPSLQTLHAMIATMQRIKDEVFPARSSLGLASFAH